MKFLLVLSIFLFLLSGCGNNNTDVDNVSNSASQISRTSASQNQDQSQINTETTKQEKEVELATFSTEILIDEENRQNNVGIACSELNGKIINAGDTFSFTGTMGPATPEKGYEKADTFEKDGDIVKEYGGGKCQISSTLYNAVLKVPGLTVVERHEHSRDVYYVAEGMDAAVAYGSVDFKFRNDNDFDVKIYASTDGEQITVKLAKIYYE